MGRLILLRHGKAVGHNTGALDKDRALVGRGRDDATAAGRSLREAELHPEIILVSPSLRTRQTWDCVKEGHGTLSATPVFIDSLYEATFAALSEVIRQSAQADRDVLVVGHNPSLHEAAVRMAAGLSSRTLPPSAEVVLGAMPTAAWIAFAGCDFDVQDRSVLAAWRP